MSSRSNPYRCYDRRYFLELVPIVVATLVGVALALTMPRTPAVRLALAGIGGGVMGWCIVVTVAAIRRLDELQQRIHLIAIAIAFAATGVVASMRRFFELLGVTEYPSGVGLWLFMFIVWNVALVVLHRRYR
jgi:hypothetical protein